MHKHTTRSISLALGFTLISVFSIPADASNNNTSVANCACATTADFVKAARQQAQAAQAGGTYLMVSTVSVRSAFIQVVSGFKWVQGETQWYIVSAAPVDASGNSLAALSETAQEAAYRAIDQSFMGTSRDFPIVLGPIQPGQTKSPIPSYFGSTDDAVWQGVEVDEITNNNPNFLVEVQPGDTVTITWQYTQSGTITAVFQVIDPQGNGKLTLKWLSATKNGKPINRDGTPATPPVIPPQGITGSFTVSGFGPVGAEWNFLLNGNGPGVEITVGDPIVGGAGGAQFVSYF
jgi:hypothetical protein